AVPVQLWHAMRRLDLAQFHWHRRRCRAVRRRSPIETIHAGFAEPAIRDFKVAWVVGHGIAHRRVYRRAHSPAAAMPAIRAATTAGPISEAQSMAESSRSRVFDKGHYHI